MEIKEFDVIKLKDGREGTVLEVLKKGAAFYVEFPTGKTGPYNWEVVQKGQIEQVSYRA